MIRPLYFYSNMVLLNKETSIRKPCDTFIRWQSDWNPTSTTFEIYSLSNLHRISRFSIAKSHFWLRRSSEGMLNFGFSLVLSSDMIYLISIDYRVVDSVGSFDLYEVKKYNNRPTWKMKRWKTKAALRFGLYLEGLSLCAFLTYSKLSVRPYHLPSNMGKK